MTQATAHPVKCCSKAMRARVKKGMRVKKVKSNTRGASCVGRAPLVVRMKVIPNAPRTELRGMMDDGTMRIAVAAHPHKGKANKELVRFLAEYFHIPKECIIIKSGLTTNRKIIYVS